MRPTTAGLARCVQLHLSAQSDRSSQFSPSRLSNLTLVRSLLLPMVVINLYARCELATQVAMSSVPRERLCMATPAADQAIFFHASWFHLDELRRFPVSGYNDGAASCLIRLVLAICDISSGSGVALSALGIFLWCPTPGPVEPGAHDPIVLCRRGVWWSFCR